MLHLRLVQVDRRPASSGAFCSRPDPRGRSPPDLSETHTLIWYLTEPSCYTLLDCLVVDDYKLCERRNTSDPAVPAQYVAMRDYLTAEANTTIMVERAQGLHSSSVRSVGCLVRTGVRYRQSRYENWSWIRVGLSQFTEAARRPAWLVSTWRGNDIYGSSYAHSSTHVRRHAP